jgi:alpha-L-rhamnosidase
MAEQTGTLWEHEGTRASCNHGFASYVAALYARNIAGIVEIDGLAKTVAVRKTDVPLDFCEMTLPVDGGTVTYGWRREGVERVETFRAPQGWRTMAARNDDCKKR